MLLAWCLMIVFGFSTCFFALAFAPLILFAFAFCCHRPRALRTTRKNEPEKKRRPDERETPRHTTHTIPFPPENKEEAKAQNEKKKTQRSPGEVVQSLRFMFPFHLRSHPRRAHERDETIIWWFSVASVAQIEMPSMVSVLWWLLAGLVDEIAGNFFCLLARAQFLRVFRRENSNRRHFSLFFHFLLSPESMEIFSKKCL